ncbi:MAG: 4-(cytidine 5'-diphospho)-2-C-methyl-D-erythritol kinase [Alphaproteobacteria bacterium]
MSRAAPAKLNLYLHVVGRRADGYHLLDSLVVFAGVADVLSVRPAGELALTVDGPFAPALAAADNIVIRAARRLAEAGEVTSGAAIHLTKRLPVGAGLGGGSSDAAAVIELLVRLWRVRLDDGRMDSLALGLGADVPVCRLGRAALVGGIGEVLAPAPTLPEAHFVLANPGRALATGDVYGARAALFSPSGRFDEAPADATALSRLLGARRNDLEPPARALMPEIGSVLAALEAESNCLLARMSGSGATCFGLFARERDARQSAERLRRRRPEWWVEAAPMLTGARALGDHVPHASTARLRPCRARAAPRRSSGPTRRAPS